MRVNKAHHRDKSQWGEFVLVQRLQTLFMVSVGSSKVRAEVIV